MFINKSSLRSLRIFVLLVIILAINSYPQSTRAQEAPPDQILRQLLESLGLPEPLETSDIRTSFTWAPDPNITIDDQTTITALETTEKSGFPGVWKVGYRQQTTQYLGQDEIHTRHKYCDTWITASMIHVEDAPLEQMTAVDPITGFNLLQLADQGYAKSDQLLKAIQAEDLDPSQYVSSKDFQGGKLHLLNLPVYDTGFDLTAQLQNQELIGGWKRLAIWQRGDWIFTVSMTTDNTEYNALIPPGSDELYNYTTHHEQCPISQHDHFDILTWVETLDQLGREQPVQPTATQTPVYDLTCQLSWSEHGPLVVDIYIRDQNGQPLQADDLEIKIGWDERRTPSGTLTGKQSLIAVRPWRESNTSAEPDWQLDNSNPISLRSFSAADGRSRFFAQVDFTQLLVPITPSTPYSMNVSAFNHNTLSGSPQELGSCTVQTGGIAVVWGIKGMPQVSSGGTAGYELVQAGRVLNKGDRLLLSMDELNANIQNSTATPESVQQWKDRMSSYVMFTYIDGTKFGVRNYCDPVNANLHGCRQYFILDAPPGHKDPNDFLGTVLAYLIGDGGEQLIEDNIGDGVEYIVEKGLTGVGTSVKTAKTGANVATLMLHTTPVQAPTLTCGDESMPEISGEYVDSIKEDYFRANKIDTRPRLSCAETEVYSLFEAGIYPGQFELKTYEGAPILHYGEFSQEVLPGQRYVIDELSQVVEQYEFDPDTAQSDWPQNFFTGGNPYAAGLGQPEGTTSPVLGLFDLNRVLVLGGAGCGLLLIVLILIILMMRRRRSRRRSNPAAPAPESLPIAPPEKLPAAPPETLSTAPPEKLDSIPGPPESLPETEGKAAEPEELPPSLDIKMSSWKLLMVSESGAGESHLLQGQVSVGRSLDSDITLDDDSSVSEHHAIFQIRENFPEVFDLNSAQGVFVNDQLIQQPVKLQAGDIVKIGKTVFVVQRLN